MVPGPRKETGDGLIGSKYGALIPEGRNSSINRGRDRKFTKRKEKRL